MTVALPESLEVGFMAIHMSGDSIEFLEGDIQIDDDGVFTFQTSVEHFSVVDDIALALIRWQQRIHKMAPEERLGSRYAIYGQGEVFHLTSPEGVPLCEKAPGSRPGSYRLLKTTGDRRKCRICESTWEERVRSIDL